MTAGSVTLSRELQRIAKDLDATITEAAGSRQGWCLVVFTEGRANYISNCPREQAAEAMQELLGAWKDGMPDVPAHNIT